MYSKQKVEKLSFEEAQILAKILVVGNILHEDVDCKEAAVYKNSVEIINLKCFNEETDRIEQYTFIFNVCGLEKVIRCITSDDFKDMNLYLIEIGQHVYKGSY